MNLKSSRRKFLKTVAAGVIGGEILTAAAPSVLAKNDNESKGFEIHKGFTVFNETTQKNMMKLAETIIPGCGSMGMKDKLMQFLRASKGSAGFFDAGFWNMEAVCRKKFNVSFYALENQSDVELIVKYIKSRNRGFFQGFKKLVIEFYYTDPRVWKQLAYEGPPQPKGFMDYSELPKRSSKVK